ncbi:MAG: hypothetical protein H7A33_08475 [Deltaproteobacteria bacterium]|nr:hypothetical protein [Deltaproteobacteria bacterium]
MDNHIIDHLHINLVETTPQHLERLSPEQRVAFVRHVIDQAEQNPEEVELLVRLAGRLLPLVAKNQKYSCVLKLFDVMRASHHRFGKEIYSFLDFSLLRDLEHLERINLANRLSESLNDADQISKEAALAGLVHLIPHLHPVHQKEYALDIFELHKEQHMTDYILKSLTSLIFDLDLASRVDITFFFADYLKRHSETESKVFVLDLLRGVTSALPEKERLAIADIVAPLIYFSNTELVKKSIQFFSDVINLLPELDRFHFTQLMAGLINDSSVRGDVVKALEKALPFLGAPIEQAQIKELLRQFGEARDVSQTSEDHVMLEWASYNLS